jgi:hypothetical protein
MKPIIRHELGFLMGGSPFDWFSLIRLPRNDAFLGFSQGKSQEANIH